MPPSGRSGYNGCYSDTSYITKQRRAGFRKWHPNLSELEIEALLNALPEKNTNKLGHHANQTSFKEGQVSPAKGISRPDLALRNKLYPTKGRKGRVSSPEFKKKVRLGVLKAYRENRLISSFGKLNRDPQFIAKQIAARGIKPNHIELKLEDILNRNFPNQYEYTGDGKLIINGLIPDFANINGKKALIEVYGDYWHSPKLTRDDWRRTELGRVMAYNSLGYRCLVIWERELTEFTEEQIVKKIKTFIKGREEKSLCL